MSRKVIIIIIGIVVVLTGAAACLRYREGVADAFREVAAKVGLATTAPATGATGQAKKAGTGTALTASGVIEATEVYVAPEVSGLILQALTGEGVEVQEGDILFEIDSALLQAQIAEADAAVDVALARLERVQVGAAPKDVAVAEAALTAAIAARDAAASALQAAVLVRDNPQELDLQIAAANTEVIVAGHKVEQASAVAGAADLMAQLRERQARAAEGVPVQVPGSGATVSVSADPATRQLAYAAWNLSTSDLWSAYANLSAAMAAKDAAASNLAQLQRQRANRQEEEIAVAQAQGQYGEAEAAVAVAERQLELLQAGARTEEVALAAAALEQARAAADVLRGQLRKYTLHAPISGVVQESNGKVGQVALAGRTLAVLANLSTVDLVIYVPQASLGQVSLGQKATVTVDSFPGQPFSGEVVWISDEAEFTPGGVQTADERAANVYAIKIRLPNPEGKLKPGMPADATLLPGGEE